MSASISDSAINVWRAAHLVLEVYWSVEVRDLGVDGFADHLAFSGMDERAQLCLKSASVESH